MARVARITGRQSIKDNLDDYVLEVGTNFEPLSDEAARLFDSYGPAKEVLDLGCGDGAAIKAFLRLGYDVTGLDINQVKLGHVPPEASTVCSDFLTYLRSMPTGYLANVFSHHALEHTPDYAEVLAEIGRVLKPGGLCLIVVPAYGELYSIHHAVFEAIDELQPPHTELVYGQERARDELEFWCLSRKL